MTFGYTHFGIATTYDYETLYCPGISICFSDNSTSTTFRPGGVYTIHNLNGQGDVKARLYSSEGSGDDEAFPMVILEDLTTSVQNEKDNQSNYVNPSTEEIICFELFALN